LLARILMSLEVFYTLTSLWGGPAAHAVCAAKPQAVSAAVAVTAFVDVNVVPMDSERVLSGYTVLVENGRIVDIGPAARVKVPVGAMRIDGRGKYLMPGLGDMHVGPSHTISPPREGQEQAFADLLFLRYVVHGVTALRSLGGLDHQVLPRLSRLGAQFPVPHLYLGLGRLPKVLWSNPDSAALGLAAIKAAGYSHVIDDQVRTDSVTMAALRRAGLPIATHSHPLAFTQALKLGAVGGSVEHLYVFWDSLLGRPGSPGQDPANQPESTELPMAKVPALVGTLRRAGVWVTPSLKCMETTHPYVQGDAFAQIVETMQDSGVKMLLGGDGWALSRWSVQKELAAMVRAGLTPYQALLTGTRNVSEYFGILDSTGTVAVGKRADLILVDGNPLQDVRHTWMPAGVMIGGRWFDRQALDQRQLAAPRLWFEELLRPQMPGGIVNKAGILPFLSSPPRSVEHWQELERRGRRVFALADSLKPSRRQTHGRVLQLLTAELGAIRALMTPDEREAFDPKIEVWLRVQGRQGYRAVIPGVPPAP
jgi:imidazolonepropionase-like amidohydrolase